MNGLDRVKPPPGRGRRCRAPPGPRPPEPPSRRQRTRPRGRGREGAGRRARRDARHGARSGFCPSAASRARVSKASTTSPRWRGPAERSRRGREGEHVRRLVLAPPVAVERAHGRVVGEEEAELDGVRTFAAASAASTAPARALRDRRAPSTRRPRWRCRDRSPALRASHAGGTEFDRAGAGWAVTVGQPLASLGRARAPAAGRPWRVSAS